MAQTVEQALADAKLYSDGELYTLVHLPAQAIMAAAGVLAEIGEPFAALVVDKDEVTLVLRALDLNEYTHRLPGHRINGSNYRLITFDVELEPALTGFMARISEALAAARVSILPYAAFSRDHLLVPADQFDAAMAALEQLRANRL